MPRRREVQKRDVLPDPKYGDKLVLFGHVNPAERLFLGSKEELLEIMEEKMDSEMDYWWEDD